jgi:nitroimidazol reductase NimA-like FMN-containing flavoprotein (pyridoxamine 5'-phosphate oxidase superfamily)
VTDDRRTRGEIPWRSIDVRLRALREVWIATTSPNGRPDAVPVWFWWDGETIFFTCASRSWKARNIAHQPEVVIHNGDGADAIILKGTARRVRDERELERVDRGYAEKYVDPHSGTVATIFVEDDHVYCVRPRLVMAWAYATMTTRTDWELA